MAGNNRVVTSPCVGICDVFDGLCMGCFRDIHEISDWHDMSDEQRQATLKKVEERRQAFKESA